MAELTSPPSAAELVDRAKALAPIFRERAAATAKARRVPDENIADLVTAGLTKVIQPKRSGGYELDLQTHFDVVSSIARGCGATGWVLGVFQAHSWLLGHFPASAQDAVYANGPDTITAAVINARGVARKAKGGLVIEGFWPFCSGCLNSSWLLLGVRVLDDAGATTDEGVVVLPTADATIKDDWYVNGLSGTGSNSIVAKDVFVPADRYLSLPQTIAGNTPGGRLHETSLYRADAVPVLALALTGTAIGVARGVLDDFLTRLPGREVAYTNHEIQRDMPATHMQVATAATKIDAAELLLRRSIEDVMNAADAGTSLDLNNRARVRMDSAYAPRLCLEAAEILFLAGGGK